MDVRFFAPGVAAIVLACGLVACGNPSVTPEARSVVSPPPQGLFQYSPLTPAILDRLKRHPGRDNVYAGNPVVLAGWDAPATTRGGNWSFHVRAGNAPFRLGDDPLDPERSMSVAFSTLDWGTSAHAGFKDRKVLWDSWARAWQPDAEFVPDGVDDPALADDPLRPARYASVAAQETLTFYGDDAGVILLRVKFVNENRVFTGGATKALETFKAAIADPQFKAEEDEQGRDGFLGLPFKLENRLPLDGCYDLGLLEKHRAEPVLTAEFANPELERKFGRWVWTIQEDYTPLCRVGPTLETVYSRESRDPDFIVVHGAGGYVDAITGKVIRFRRNYRVYGVLEEAIPSAGPEGRTMGGAFK